MPDPSMTIRIDSTLDYIDLVFPDALSGEVEANITVPEGSFSGSFTGTAGDDVGQIILDSGNLASGVYKVTVLLAQTTGGADMDFQHRNAGDTANIASVRFDSTVSGVDFFFTATLRLLLNESIRVVLQEDIASGTVVAAKFLLDRIAL